MNRLQFLSGCMLVFLLAACSDEQEIPHADSATLRSTPAGPVTGFASSNGAHGWRGLPFAQPPVGELRWRAPRPLQSWQENRLATSFAEPCAQPVSQLGGTQSSGDYSGREDCLYLDIYAPPMTAAQSQDAALPVMFWIHGGGNSIGSTSSYDGSVLARQENVIVVAAQYRLGPFGWFYQPGLATTGDSAADRSGNFGTLDLIQGLAWTRDNIRAFGGDPDNVTIFGESAGGFNVFSLLLSPLADGLFRQAIAQSGSVQFADIASATTGSANASFAATQRMLTRAGNASPGEPDIAQLRSLSAEQILAAYEADTGSGMIRMPTILHDGHVLPKASALESFAARQYHHVPTILGTNKDEQKLFQYLDPDYTDRWFGIWSRPIDKAVYARDAWYKTTHWRLMGVEEPARRMSGAPVYAYRFDWDDLGTPLGMDFSFMFGAAHAFEIPFVFGGIGLGPLGEILDTTPHPEDRVVLGNAMMRYWANFARTGNPNASNSDLPVWKPWGRHEQFLVFDADRDGGIRMSRESTDIDAFAARLASDQSFEGIKERCHLYQQLLARGDLLQKYNKQMACQ